MNSKICFTRNRNIFYLSSDCIDERRDLLEVGDRCLNPEKVSSILKTGHAVQDHSGAVTVLSEPVETIGHPNSLAQLAVSVDQCLSLLEISDGVDGDRLQEAVVLSSQVSSLLGHGERGRSEAEDRGLARPQTGQHGCYQGRPCQACC